MGKQLSKNLIKEDMFMRIIIGQDSSTIYHYKIANPIKYYCRSIERVKSLKH